jgi:hypothetical protein
VAAGIDGAVAPDAVLVGFHNRGGNKLDPFIAVKGKVETRAVAAGWAVTLDMSLQNNTPTKGLSQYVQGPYPGSRGAAAGLYQAFAVFELPRYAATVRVEVEGKPVTLITGGPDGPSQVAAAYVEVPRGSSRRVVARFVVPPGIRSLRFAPSARVPAVLWSASHLGWSDDHARAVVW